MEVSCPLTVFMFLSGVGVGGGLSFCLSAYLSVFELFI